ncbi:sugar ABC transporter ATP-binding protein [Aureimonas pseudogalii]|uniref:Simple sugar transport system ATP-binding protein n=1 Tax=Aureimonas pseudogalii TaxID=1744844 RepID=A0A7W6EF34_9HYPH|nr:sugar ABC transporter ATP-binding protein [Aureimonas pseudogalii]MBB3996704.1 simple sugar transport system ATP-binding protein [Aureimonas pseudogalii]
MSEPLLAIENLGKSFAGMTALAGVDLTLRAGEIHALLGENGAGKSTLIKTLTGVYRRDGGTIRLAGTEIHPADSREAQSLGIGTVYQEVNLLPNLSVAENLFLGRQPMRFGFTDGRTMRRRSAELLASYGLDVDPAATLGQLSVAVQQLVAIIRAVDVSGKVLILDEPTASLDAAEVETLFAAMRRLRDQGLAILFVTHFLDQVFAVCDRATVLRNGRLVGERAIKETSQMEIVTMMLGRELTEAVSHPVRAAAPDGPPRVAFRGFGRKRSVEPFDLEIRPGEAVGVAGLLGSGRTETARLVFGADRADTGEALVDGKPVRLTNPRAAIQAGFGYCPEERKVEGIVGDLSVRENIILALQARRGWTKPLPMREQVRIADRFVKALDIRTTDIEKPIKLLSGGNQQKAILARWLATEPTFLILDEPTRGIDVGAHAEIVRLIESLCADGMAMLVISSELEEITTYSSRVRVLRDRRHLGDLTGDEINPAAIMRTIAGTDAPARA